MFADIREQLSYLVEGWVRTNHFLSDLTIFLPNVRKNRQAVTLACLFSGLRTCTLRFNFGDNIVSRNSTHIWPPYSPDQAPPNRHGGPHDPHSVWWSAPLELSLGVYHGVTIHKVGLGDACWSSPKSDNKSNIVR